MLKKIKAAVLDVPYEENGASNGKPVLLLHGFPCGILALALALVALPAFEDVPDATEGLGTEKPTS